MMGREQTLLLEQEAEINLCEAMEIAERMKSDMEEDLKWVDNEDVKTAVLKDYAAIKKLIACALLVTQGTAVGGRKVV